MEFAYDTDPKQAANSRVKMRDMLAANKIPVLTYHYPWPGMGHIAKNSDRRAQARASAMPRSRCR